MTRAVIFDYGGVIIRNVPDEFVKGEIRDWSEEKEKKYLIDLGRADRGEVNDEEAKILFDGYFGPGSWDRVSTGELKSVARPDRGIISLIKNLHRNYKVGLLSNNVNYWSDMAKAQEYLQFFDAVVFSDDVGIDKPQKEIYELIAAKLEVDLKDCVFIDDTLANVIGAEAAGMVGIKYEGFEKLAKRLEELKVRF